MSTKIIHRVRSMVERGERINQADCRELFEIKDLGLLAKLARVPRERRFGKVSHYRAAYAAPYRGEHPEFFIAEMQTAAPEETAELVVRLRWREGETLGLWRERLREFSRASVPAVAQLSAGFVARLATAEASGYEAVLSALMEAGTIQLTGEEAELFDERLRASTTRDLLSAQAWLDVHRAAHRLGLKSYAAMSYGTIDHPDEYASHLATLRDLQDETGGFSAFVPMAIHNQGVEAFYLAAPTAAQTLRTSAIARMFFDNIPHVVSSPALVTLEIATIALSYGADTVDGTFSTDEVHAVERIGTAIPMLTVLGDEGGEPGGDITTGFHLIESRVREARWTPQGVNSHYSPVGLLNVE